MSRVESIVLVDDEHEQLRQVAGLLQDKGFRVFAFDAPEAALHWIERNPFDLLISDLRLPQIDGMAFIKRARAMNDCAECVLMTGHSSVDTAIDAIRLGVADYLLKPFKAAELMAVVDRALYVKRLKEQNQSLLEGLKRSNAQLRDVNSQLDSFAGRVAHDLNSMISLIQSYSRALDKNIAANLDETSRRFLSRIRTVSDRGSALVSDLLAFARLGNRALTLSEVDVGTVVERARLFAELDAKQHGIEWRIGELPWLRADESLFEQVFSNLFSNAVKYTRHVEKPAIEVQWWESLDFHHFVVSDNGAGFDASRADELFLPFKRLHADSDFEGNGLGLVNVKRIVEKHRGSIQGRGELGQGARFEFCIHKAPDASAQEPVQKAVEGLDEVRFVPPAEPRPVQITNAVDDLLAQCVHKLNNAMLPFVLELDDQLDKMHEFAEVDQIKLRMFDQETAQQLASIKRVRALISKKSIADFER